jgi:hypothetical protein
MNKVMLKFIQYKGPRIAKIIMENDIVEGLMLPDFETY